MPYPSVIVTFTDADGDEFPVRVPDSGTAEHRLAQAEREAADMVKSGAWRPTGSLTFVSEQR